ncbi:NAD(P)H-dependent oxidoreductase subunit E [Hyphobacterium marinum]|uniref:NAD(P)H-dependent oxidoreductase subunit E n=1 Tax=Hyphobacterium marinum TaxID=3116574 RepID=A0ABU7LVW3_9PROT|nr:NAD(P)H-dependent oxidoreductase subunit E [Hyphobacterium sp. Y6023]MEE2565691.1 NAD(P)H-dependent oxidoreductase subunit E [Hyphobacterium sp. Y6023]
MNGSEADEAVRAIAAAHANRPDALIEMLHDVQHRFGCVDDAALRTLAHAINRSRAEVHGVRSFYTDFTEEPQGRCVVKLCRAESCQAAGGDALAADLERDLGCSTGATSPDGGVTLEAVYCLGNCALSPAAMVDGDLIGRADRDTILARVKGGGR